MAEFQQFVMQSIAWIKHVLHSVWGLLNQIEDGLSVQLAGTAFEPYYTQLKSGLLMVPKSLWLIIVPALLMIWTVARLTRVKRTAEPAVQQEVAMNNSTQVIADNATVPAVNKISSTVIDQWTNTDSAQAVTSDAPSVAAATQSSIAAHTIDLWTAHTPTSPEVVAVESVTTPKYTVSEAAINSWTAPAVQAMLEEPAALGAISASTIHSWTAPVAQVAAVAEPAIDSEIAITVPKYTVPESIIDGWTTLTPSVSEATESAVGTRAASSNKISEAAIENWTAASSVTVSSTTEPEVNDAPINIVSSKAIDSWTAPTALTGLASVTAAAATSSVTSVSNATIEGWLNPVLSDSVVETPVVETPVVITPAVETPAVAIPVAATLSGVVFAEPAAPQVSPTREKTSASGAVVAHATPNELNALTEQNMPEVKADIEIQGAPVPASEVTKESLMAAQSVVSLRAVELTSNETIPTQSVITIESLGAIEPKRGDEMLQQVLKGLTADQLSLGSTKKAPSETSAKPMNVNSLIRQYAERTMAQSTKSQINYKLFNERSLLIKWMTTVQPDELLKHAQEAHRAEQVEVAQHILNEVLLRGNATQCAQALDARNLWMSQSKTTTIHTAAPTHGAH